MWLDTVRQSFRMLAHHRTFTITALLALALGVGVNTAIFSVLNAVLLKPLPFVQPERLVLIRERLPKLTAESIPVPAGNTLFFQEHAQAFAGMAAVQTQTYEFAGPGLPSRAWGARVDPSLLQVLGAAPAMGGWFTAEDDRTARPVIVLSHGLWQAQFASQPQVVGTKVLVNRRPYTVVGVMPRTFVYPLPGMRSQELAAFWVPLSLTAEERTTQFDNYNMDVVARLKPDQTIPSAQADMGRVIALLSKQIPAELARDWQLEAEVVPLHGPALQRVRPLMLVLLGAVGFILLIASANVASLILSRATARQRELAIRAAMGATRGQLVRQLVTESAVLGLLAGLAGVLLAVWGTSWLGPAIPEDIPRVHEVTVDWRVFSFALAAALAASMMAGVLPALLSARIAPDRVLREGARGSGGPGTGRWRAAFVVSQLSLAMVLLVGAGLLLHSFARLSQDDLGFRPEHTVTFSLSLPEAQYPSGTQEVRFYEDLAGRLRRLPGVKAAGTSTDLPLDTNWARIFFAEGTASQAHLRPVTMHSLVHADYFGAVGATLRAGRLFDEHDRGNPVVLVNESMAQRVWPGESVVGKRIKWGAADTKGPWLTVIGVVSAMRDRIDQEPRPHTYEPLPRESKASFRLPFSFAVRTEGDPAALGSAIREQVRSMDSQLAVAKLQTLSFAVDEALAGRRWQTGLLSLLAALAVGLAALGVYGVMAQVVLQRTREFGIRLALGATRGNVLRLVLRHTALLAAGGAMVGVAGALALARTMQSLVYGVSPYDVLSVLGGSAVLLVAVVAASVLPVWQATRVDPAIALRNE